MEVFNVYVRSLDLLAVRGMQRQRLGPQKCRAGLQTPKMPTK